MPHCVNAQLDELSVGRLQQLHTQAQAQTTPTRNNSSSNSRNVEKNGRQILQNAPLFDALEQ